MKGYALLIYKVVSDFGNEKLFGNHASLKLIGFQLYADDGL